MVNKVVSLASKRRKHSPRDIVAEGFERGQPLPLEVLLANLEHWYRETLRLEASGNPADAPLARIARQQSQRAAVDAAPYCHQKLSQRVIASDPEQPLKVDHQLRIDADALRGRGVQELGAIYVALATGDNDKLADLCPAMLPLPLVKDEEEL